MKRRLTIVAIAAFALALCIPAIASATVLPSTGASTNDACLGCHAAGSTVTGVTVDFGVGPVDKATACQKCHWISPHPVHNQTQNCNALCHSRWDWGTRTDFWVSQSVADPVATGSYFNSNTSVNTSPEELHRIHTRRSWMAELADYSPKCAGCHAPASCDACHESITNHGGHGVSGDPLVGDPTVPEASNLTRGVPVADLRSGTDFSFDGQSACIASGCHAGVAPGYFVDDTQITYGGEWTTVANANLLGGSYTYSTSTAATFEVTFTGTGVSWIGQRTNTGGISEVYIDGVLKKSANCYSMPWGFGRNISVILGLPYGEHTLTVKNTTRTSYLWNYIFVQGIRVYGAKPDFVAAPDCSGCHDQHGDLTARHTSTWTMDGCTAANCHLTNELAAEHDKWRPTDTCALCHGSTVSTTVSAAVGAGITACDACHTSLAGGATHRTLHESDVPLVDASGAPQYGYYTGTSASIKVLDCAGCHTDNLVDEHMGGSGRLPRYDASGAELTCASCHESTNGTVLLAIAGGVSNCDACHTVHAPLWAAHTSDYTSNPVDTCGDCHSSSLEAVHQNVVATMPSGAQLTGCAVCHGYTEGAFGALVQGAIETTDGTGRRCTACHDAYHTAQDARHAAVSLASDECGVCHDTDPATPGMDVAALHAGADEGPCRVCHANPARVPDITTVTAECSSCHATQGVDYHSAMSTAHTYSGMDSSCSSAGCHAANTLPEAHEACLERYPQYGTTCALCHRNSDPARIDWVTASADCSTCHDVHGDIGVIHTAPESSECTDCHETADVIVLHGGQTSCARCHNATLALPVSAKCVNCHGDHSPIDPAHYPVDRHDASAQSGCDQCHSKDMKTEHFKPTVAVSCVRCHEESVDLLTGAWDKTCTSCHPTKHGEQGAKHQSANTGCGGTGCHDITDVSKVHASVVGGGCAACHVSSDSPATTTDCMACHPSATPSHHEEHNASAANPKGCSGCHAVYLDDEHLGLGLTCGTCHDSVDPVVQRAITEGDRSCLTCHPGSPHNKRQAWEFNPNQASGHRVSVEQPGMRSTFVVSGVTYTWSLPSAASFLKSGWTTSSTMTCDGCHTYSGANGPHGSSMKVNIDPAYPTNWKSAYLTNSASGMSSTGVICAKCHDLNGPDGRWSNGVHGDGEHQDSRNGKCIACHVQVPHGWGRPRLLGTVSDPAPYASANLTGLKLKSYTPSRWSVSDCAANCEEHGSRMSPAWPAGSTATPPAPTMGTVAGVVTDGESGAVLGAASVTVGAATVITGGDGAFTVADLPAGTYAANVTLAGYDAWTGSVTVIAGETAVLNVSLRKAAPVAANLALSGQANASSYYSGNYTPSKAIDGSTSSYWRSRGSNEEWLSVDLGSARSVSKLVIDWDGSYYARSYRLEVSVDGVNWTEVYATTNGGSSTQTVEFAAVPVRYARLYCTRSNYSSYRVSEFGVWGF